MKTTMTKKVTWYQDKTSCGVLLVCRQDAAYTLVKNFNDWTLRRTRQSLGNYCTKANATEALFKMLFPTFKPEGTPCQPTSDLKAHHASSSATGSANLRVEGPVANGFFIHDGQNVWGNGRWKGFGPPTYYETFQEAHQAMRKINSPNVQAEARRD